MRLVQAQVESKSRGVEIGLESDSVEVGLTSFDMVQIVLNIEKAHGLKFPDEELIPRNFDSVISIAKITQKVLTESRRYFEVVD